VTAVRGDAVDSVPTEVAPAPVGTACRRTAMDRDPTLRSVGELMTPNPIVVAVDAPLPQVADLLDRFDISGLPVVDHEGQLVGVISQTDLLRARANEDLWARWLDLTARNLMSSPALVASAGTSVFEVVTRLEAHHVHRLVVVADDGSTPIGVISTTDLVRAIAARTGR
jgi:CBS domain-containing protein